MPEDTPCARVGCGHLESEHQSELGFCDEYGCACQGFVSEEEFEPVVDEVEELHLGEDNW